MNSLLRLYSRFISSSERLPECKASQAAIWLMIEAHKIVYWWIFVIAAITAFGPHA